MSDVPNPVAYDAALQPEPLNPESVGPALVVSVEPVFNPVLNPVLSMAAMRVQHTLLLLRLLWQQDAPRIDLSRQVGLSRSAISSIVQELMTAGLVQETGARVSERVGRRATMLSLNAEAAYLLAVDLGASHVRVALLDLRCTILACLEQPHDIVTGPAPTYALIADLARQVLAHRGIATDRVAAVGVGIPGPLDWRSGAVICTPNMTGWDGEHVAGSLAAVLIDAGLLGAGLNAPVLVDNDANLGVLAEWRFGALRGVADLIYIKAATGIGSGMVLGGQLYRGVSGGAGEIGHISIGEQGTLGHRGPASLQIPGSLESYAAAPAVLARMRARLPQVPDTALHADSTMEDLTRLSLSDALASELWAEVGQHLGLAVSTALNLFNPSAVVIGGQMAAAGEPLLLAVRRVVQERTTLVNRSAVNISLSTLGRDTGVLGAGVMMLERLFSPSGIGQLTRASTQAAHPPETSSQGSRAPPNPLAPGKAAAHAARNTPFQVPAYLPGLPTSVPALSPHPTSTSTSLTEDHT